MLKRSLFYGVGNNTTRARPKARKLVKRRREVLVRDDEGMKWGSAMGLEKRVSYNLSPVPKVRFFS